MTEKTDPLAENAARNALADLICCSTVDLSEDGCGDPESNADHLAGLVAGACTVTWERQVNIDPGHGPTRGTPGDPNVYVRRYVLRGPWETDPEGKAHMDALEKRLTDMLAARRTAPAEEAEMKALAEMHHRGMADAFDALIEAFRNDAAAGHISPETLVREVAERRGVAL